MSDGAFESSPTSQALYDATRKRRRNKRSRRKDDGDVTYLNITPMMDMMTILLVFLLKSFSASAQDVNVANLVLPHSATKLNTEEALTLMVTKAEVLVDQRVIAQLDGKGNFRVADLPEGQGGYLVKPLYEALSERAGYYKRIEELGGTQFLGRIAIIADKTTNYRTLFRVLYTAGRSEFGFFKLFVRKPPG